MTPYNLTTGKSYSGGNVTRLSLHSYDSNAWLTLRQANKLGGKVTEGEHGTKLFHFKWEVVTDAKGKPRRKRVMNVFHVYNVAQCELPAEALTKVKESVKAAA